MTSRYEILDILSQDGNGVIFHASDRETGNEVVLRRFFPFGTDGGGLEEEERLAYEVGVSRLREIRHPALRAVLDGGTDPVDGMPFLVTEWVDGEKLSDRLAEGPLDPGSVRSLADLALEISQLLSEVFGEEAVWVETEPSSIIVSESDPSRQVTFWISPLRWLGDPGARSDLKPLLGMVEDLTGWRGHMVSRSSGAGLGAWVKTLRDHPGRWTLGEAKAALHEPATMVEQAAQTASAPAPRVIVVERQSVWPWIITATLALAAAGLFAWQKFNPPSPAVADSGNPTAAPPADPDPPALTADPAKEPAADGDTTESPPAAQAESLSPPVATPPPATKEASPKSRLEEMNRRAAAMAAQAEANAMITPGESATLEGTVVATESSESGKSHYLRFRTGAGDQMLWAMFRSSDWEDFDPGTLDRWTGRKARFSGRWTSENSPRKFVLRMSRPSQLEPIK